MIECLLKNRPNSPINDSTSEETEQEVNNVLLSLGLSNRNEKILSACEVQPLNVIKAGLTEIMQESLREHCDQGRETMLLCECIHRLDEDIYEDNRGEVATVVEILHPGLYGDDVTNADKSRTGSAYVSCEHERQPLELNNALRQRRRQTTTAFNDATTVHVF